MHTGQELIMLYDNLPKLFLNDVGVMFQKHFVYQWLSTKLLPLTLAAIPPVSTAFARWLLNLPVENKTVNCKLHKKDIHLPSLITYITKDASLIDIKQQTFFQKHSSAVAKIAEGCSLFDTDDLEVLSLQQYVKENWIPLPSATQLVESKVKDTSFYKSTGKSEWNTSNIAMIRSLIIPTVSSAIKESESFKNRVRRNEDAKDFLHNQQYNTEVLMANFNRQAELKTIPDQSIEYSKMILSKNHHYHNKRHHDTVDKYTKSKDVMKRPNASI